MLGDFGILREQLEQRLAGGGDFAADVVDEVVGALASEMRAEPHHHRLRDDHAVGEIEIDAHALGVDLEPFDQEPGLRQRARREQKDFGQCDPLDLPRPGRALVIGDGGLEQGGDVLAHQRGGGMDIEARDRVAFLRHCAR